jgi:glycosyltransferase involved in cell wall biosynthesis
LRIQVPDAAAIFIRSFLFQPMSAAPSNSQPFERHTSESARAAPENISPTSARACAPIKGGSMVAIIPVYRPGRVLLDIINALTAGDWEMIVVVDDGSGPLYAPVFLEILEPEIPRSDIGQPEPTQSEFPQSEIRRVPKVEVITHPVNRGKGSALKTGIDFVLHAGLEIAGVVTLDADGQHDPRDVQRISDRFREHPDALVLGVRDFGGKVPIRSKLGNRITRRVMRAVMGRDLVDSQTGLRAIPAALLPTLMKLRSSGYEFELEALIAAKHHGVEVIEAPIRTIYAPGNPSSHFRPFFDSMRIYFVLLRFAAISIVTAAIDNLVFYLLFGATGNVLASQLGGRVLAILFNYTAVRRAVFLSDQPHRVVLPRYLLVAASNVCLSYAGIELLTKAFALSVFEAKIIAETTLFLANFWLQRDFVFTRRGARATS